ncbi:MAG: hypothetical protein VX083_02475 [Pseudomonadota bacterium]|jgi:hypothetical protein|nr:hypothetical protein [Thalassovita sp.]MEC7965454.1 hypothetical protein [Pseudomonadota bacterium]MEC8040863.1 hypothetical protein [Pseudomonadota bacterium]MEC8292338.1 hypothetical protein [Pseudomonadota bacterium]
MDDNFTQVLAILGRDQNTAQPGAFDLDDHIAIRLDPRHDRGVDPFFGL